MILNVELLFLMISVKNKLRIMLENSKAFRQKRFGNVFGLIVFVFFHLEWVRNLFLFAIGLPTLIFHPRRSAKGLSMVESEPDKSFRSVLKKIRMLFINNLCLSLILI